MYTTHHDIPPRYAPFYWNVGDDDPDPLDTETEIRVSRAILRLIEERGIVSRQELAIELERFGAGTLLQVLSAMLGMERIELDHEGLIRLRPLRVRDRSRSAA